MLDRIKAVASSLLARAGTYLRTHRKQVYGIVSWALAWVATHVGLSLDPTQSAAISTAISGLIIGKVPNAQA